MKNNKYKVGIAYTIEDNDNIIGFVADKDDAKMIIEALNNVGNEEAQKKIEQVLSILGGKNQKKAIIDDFETEPESVSDDEIESDSSECEVAETKKSVQTYTKICPNCKKTFTCENNRKKFCSNKCKSDYHHQFRTDTTSKKPLEEQNWKWIRTCPVCGKKFGTNFQEQVYCGKECRTKFQNERDRKLAINQTSGLNLPPDTSIVLTNSDTITSPEGMKPPKKWCGSELTD